MAPVNGRAAIDPRWTRHHTPVAADFMLATIRVVRKNIHDGDVHYNPITKEYEGASVTEVWTGKARVQPYGIIGDQIVAQDPTGRRLMRVQIEDISTGIRVDDELTVIDAPENPELTTYTMEVRGAINSSNAWLTDLVCEANVKGYVSG